MNPGQRANEIISSHVKVTEKKERKIRGVMQKYYYILHFIIIYIAEWFVFICLFLGHRQPCPASDEGVELDDEWQPCQR